MNFSFGFMPPHAYLHYAGVWSDAATKVHDYELVDMSADAFLEFKRLLSELSNTPGVSVTYDPAKHCYTIKFMTPSITTMDSIRVEYPE